MNTIEKQEHWENIYETKQPTEVSWFRPHLESSLRLIDAIDMDTEAKIIDVGGGASTLVDDLLERGFGNITVMDISSGALERTRERLGDRASGVS